MLESAALVDGIDHITLTYIFFGSKSELPESYASLGFEGAPLAATAFYQYFGVFLYENRAPGKMQS